MIAEADCRPAGDASQYCRTSRDRGVPNLSCDGGPRRCAAFESRALKLETSFTRSIQLENHDGGGSGRLRGCSAFRRTGTRGLEVTFTDDRARGEGAAGRGR